MALRTRSKQKKASTKYSAIGATVVPLSQQMKSNSKTPTSKVRLLPKLLSMFIVFTLQISYIKYHYTQISNHIISSEISLHVLIQTTTPSNDNFFDDDFWNEPLDDKKKKKSNNTNISGGLGIHKTNDVSSSESLEFTPTPPPSNKIKLKTSHSNSNSPGNNRSLFYLGNLDAKDTSKSPYAHVNKSNANGTQQQPGSSPNTNQNHGSNGHHTSTNTNTQKSNSYTSNLFDNLMGNNNAKPKTKPTPSQNGSGAYLKEVAVVESPNEAIRNDPNYLPPPEENSTPSITTRDVIAMENSEDGEDDDDEDDGEVTTATDVTATPGQNEMNPWAHLNKVVTTSITEAPINIDDDGDGQESRGFLRMDDDGRYYADTPSGYTYSPKGGGNGNGNGQTSLLWKCCYCLIFIIGIVIGVLLTIALIRHQAIDSNYLNYGTPSETESDSVIETELNDPYQIYNPYINKKRNESKYEKQDKHRNFRIDSDESYDEYDSTIDTEDEVNVEDILNQIQGVKKVEQELQEELESTTPSPTRRWNRKKETTEPPTITAIIAKVTNTPTKSTITNQPSKDPTKLVTPSPTHKSTKSPTIIKLTTSSPTQAQITIDKNVKQTPSPTQIVTQSSNQQGDQNEDDANKDIVNNSPSPIDTATQSNANPDTNINNPAKSQPLSTPATTVANQGVKIIEDDEVVNGQAIEANNLGQKQPENSQRVVTTTPSIQPGQEQHIQNDVSIEESVDDRTNSDDSIGSENDIQTKSDSNEQIPSIEDANSKNNEKVQPELAASNNVTKSENNLDLPKDVSSDNAPQNNENQDIPIVDNEKEKNQEDDNDDDNTEGVISDSNLNEEYDDEGQKEEANPPEIVKTTGTPTDYHHVHWGIEQADKWKQEQEEKAKQANSSHSNIIPDTDMNKSVVDTDNVISEKSQSNSDSLEEEMISQPDKQEEEVLEDNDDNNEDKQQVSRDNEASEPPQEGSPAEEDIDTDTEIVAEPKDQEEEATAKSIYPTPSPAISSPQPQEGSSEEADTDTEITSAPNNKRAEATAKSVYPTPSPVISPPQTTNSNLTISKESKSNNTNIKYTTPTASPSFKSSADKKQFSNNNNSAEKDEPSDSDTEEDQVNGEDESQSPETTQAKMQEANDATQYPTPTPIDEESQSLFIESQSFDEPDPIWPGIKPICDVTPNDKCGSGTKPKLLPIPFDKPLSAQLRCHTNTCKSPPTLPGQRIITGYTFEAGKTVLDIDQDIPTQCHVKHFHSIAISRDGYENDEDWKWCLRISNDNSMQEFPKLHVTFSLIDFDLEQGFDNLFLTTQFNDDYDDYAETWTGTWESLHKFEPNTWYQNYWITSSEPDSFSEFCLRLQSDESMPGKGFNAKFTITREIGDWDEWSECTAHSNTPGIANGACGIGVQSRVASCPDYIKAPKTADEYGRFDWSNGTHSCINKYSNYPLSKYCIVANCADIDNDKVAPEGVIQKHQQSGDWDTKVRDYIYNGKSRIDPQFADPFHVYPNIETDTIDLDGLKKNLQTEVDTILARYPEKSRDIFPDVMQYQYSIHFEKLGDRLLSSLILGKVFTFVTTGSSNTAGHDNVFMSAYPMQLQSLMQVIWNKYAITGGAFRVRDQAIGGHLGTQKQGPCLSAIVGTYDKNIDMISWESFMNDGSHVPPEIEEIWLRNALLTYGVDNEHSQPFITCVSTSDREQGGCRLTGRYVMNSFIKHYYNSTGVANYFGQAVCNKGQICTPEEDENGKPTTKYCFEDDAYAACRAPAVSWHPSPHRHRVMAEAFAVNFLNSAIQAIDRLGDKINGITSKSNGKPNYELACLMEDYLGEIWDEAGIVSTVDKNHAAFRRPVVEPQTQCGNDGLCENAMWCAISFWPSPKHNQLHRYFVDNDGFKNDDTIDLPVDPLIMRKGGRAPIDHKAQWLVDATAVGSYLEIRVKVPKQYIMIIYPQGTSKIATKNYLGAFEMTVDGIKKECVDPAIYPNGVGNRGDKSFCLLDVEKPGKYSLKLTLITDSNPLLQQPQKTYAIDEIAGI